MHLIRLHQPNLLGLGTFLYFASQHHPLPKPKDVKRMVVNTLTWGFFLWLFGYFLGIVFFMLVPKEQIGRYVLPLGVLVTIWVLIEKVKRESLFCYVMVGVIWTVMAVVLDYLFIVKLLHSTDYYKQDVLVYYALTLVLPIIVGWLKMRKAQV